MSRLTVTVHGQVTFRKEVLDHLGIKAGDDVEIDLLPGGRAALKAPSARPTGTINAFFGVLAGKTRKVATLDEISQAVAEGWAGHR